MHQNTALRERERLEAVSWLFGLYNTLLFLLLFSSILTTVSFADTSKNKPTKDTKIFQVSEKSQKTYPELIKLIKNTESMNDDEKQYWFDLLPSMTNSQVDKLFNILDTERKKLEELELKYQDEIKILNDKHLQEWEKFQIKDTLKKLSNEKKGTLLVFVENPSSNKNTMPFTLAFSNDFKDIEEILVKDNFERFDISKPKNYINGILFNNFATFVEQNFKAYYELYRNNIFLILETYYKNISNSHHRKITTAQLERIKSFISIISDNDKKEFEKLVEKIEFFYFMGKPYQETNDILNYYATLATKNGLYGDMFQKMHHTFFVNYKDAQEFIKVYMAKIKEDNYTYLDNYKKYHERNQYLKSQIIILHLFLEKYHTELDSELKEKLKSFIENILNSEIYFQKQPYYYEMTKLFLSNDSNALSEKVNFLKIQYENNPEDEEIQAKLLEYIAYFTMKKQIQYESNQKDYWNNEDYLKDLAYFTSLKNSIKEYSKAGSYLELKFIDFLNQDKLNKEKENLKKQISIRNLIMQVIKLAISIVGTFFTILAIINFIFRGLLLNNEKNCSIVTWLLLLKFKFISDFTKKILLKKLYQYLLSKISKHTNQKITLDDTYEIVTYTSYNDNDSKLSLIEAISKKYNIVPIIIKKDIDLRIGCLDNLLHNIEFSDYLFALDSHYFGTKEQKEIMTNELLEKYPNAKIIIFTKSS